MSWKKPRKNKRKEKMKETDCPYCRSYIADFPKIEMQGTPVLCDTCTEVSICDNGVLRKMTEAEFALFAAGPAFELVAKVREKRGQNAPHVN